MKIGGWQPLSLSDYPGRVAAVVFTQGCNFRCPFCHNGSLLPADPTVGVLIPETEILAHLAERRTLLEGVVVSGGEPTLQPDLPDFLRQLRALGLAVKLDTNGSRPEVLRALLHEGLLNYIAMDVKAPFDAYPRLCGVSVDIEPIRESIARISASGLPHQFRATLVPGLHREGDPAAIAALLPPGETLVRQAFQPEHALDPRLRARPLSRQESS